MNESFVLAVIVPTSLTCVHLLLAHYLPVTQGLEYCEERYSQELGGSAFPARAQTTNIRLLSCQTIEKFRPHPDRDDSMNEGWIAFSEAQRS